MPRGIALGLREAGGKWHPAGRYSRAAIRVPCIGVLARILQGKMMASSSTEASVFVYIKSVILDTASHGTVA